MKYDSKVPNKLKNTQIWFAGVITRSMDEDNRIDPIAPSGMSLDQEAAEFVSPSPTLKPIQRMEIYNQQYWWRLLKALQDNFLFLTRLFGYHDFNQTIAVPYISAYPSDHWSLTFLGSHLPKWIEANYHGRDKQLVLDASLVDLAYIKSFLCEEHPKINVSAQDPDALMELTGQKLYWQPFVQLFQFPYEIFKCRQKFLEHDPEYWVENEFPELEYFPKEQMGHFVLYRDHHNQVNVERIGSSEYTVLEKFDTGTSIDSICEWLEKEPPDSVLQRDAQTDLGIWFQRWVALNWVTLSPNLPRN